MHTFAQGIAPRENAGEMLRQRLDDRNLEREPPVLNQVWQRVALLQKDPGALRQPCEAASQLRRRLGRTERLDAEAVSGEGVKRNIDTVQIAVVGGAVLQVVDNLQRRADGVGREPSAMALAMHVEHETSDRHRGVGAVPHEIVPVAVAQFGGVETKRLEEILRVAGGHAAQDLLKAFRLDATKLRYRDWDDLMGYCTYSAMPVGRFVLDVHGESRDTWFAVSY